ncbi:MAG TPA: Uma2 family endonuclease [Chloroflexota bacterium]|nr:Uma2 family endonuclease [Chloroflexota bacterium]
MQQQRAAVAPREWAPWPPDDTEESIVGSEIHQRVIDTLRDGLDMAAAANGATWHTLSQVPISGFRRPDGSPYTMLPDVFVHPRLNPHPESGANLTFAEVGVPLLAIEVLSDSTFRKDLDDQRGKAWSYADAGVSEYLIVDYGLRYMEEPVRALRLAHGHWTPWPVSAAGRWESAALGVSFAFDGLYLRVYDAEGRLKPMAREADEQLRARIAQLHEQAARIEVLQDRLRALAAAGDLAGIQALLADPESA